MSRFKLAPKDLNMDKLSKQTSESRSEREKEGGIHEDKWERVRNLAPNKYNAVPDTADSIEPEYREVDISLVTENPYNARDIYDINKIKLLAASIKVDGQLVPTIGVRRGENYLLIAGHYRLKALRYGDIKTVKMMVYPEGSVTDQQIYEYSFKENEERSEQTVLDNAIAWKRVLDEGIYESLTELSEAIGVTQPTITKTLSALSLPQSVLEVIKESPELFGLSMIYELQRYAKLAPEAKSIKVARLIKTKDISRQDIISAREALEKKGGDDTKRKNQMSRSYQLDYSSGSGSIKEWDSGKIQVEITMEDEEEKARFLNYIQSYQSN